ncbi:MAG: c-type cytochrome, partial [Mariniblastus sp.]
TRGPYYQPIKWEETENIHRLLMDQLRTNDSPVTAHLMEQLAKNRIDLTEAMEQILELASSDPKLVEPAVTLLSNVNRLSSPSVKFLISAVGTDLTPATLKTIVFLLSKTSDPENIPVVFSALDTLNHPDHEQQYIKQAREQFFKSKLVNKNLKNIADYSMKPGKAGFWADCALLAVATQKKIDPVAKSICDDVLQRHCSTPLLQERIISAAIYLKNHKMDEFILASLKSDRPELAQASAVAAKALNLSLLTDRSAKLGSLDAKSAVDQAMQIKGDRGHGETIFIKSNCTACHTTKLTEKQKGPYLGNITKTYRPRELAMAILMPNQTIAQGFKTNIILDLDGRLVSGYVTEESAEKVVLRDQEGKEFIFSKDEIDSRKESKLSSMPDNLLEKNTLYDLASLISYLEYLSQGSQTPEE